MCDPQYLREAIRAAKEAMAIEADHHATTGTSVAFIYDGYHTKTTPLNFQQLALLVEAAEGVVDV